MNVSNLMKLKWKDYVEKVTKVCNSRLICGLNVYLGNIREPHMELQPYVAIRNELTRDVAKSMYGDWERWDHVPEEITRTISSSQNASGPSTYNNWVMVELSNKNMVEEIRYYDKWTNTYQIMLNGIPMLPVGFPLEYLVGEIEYPISKGDAEPIPFFAYSRSVPAKNKFNQAAMDEFFKSILLKQRKSYNPPMANNTGQMLSKRIFYPAEIIDNIDTQKLQPIGDTSGISRSDLEAMQLIKSIIDESSISAIFQGDTPAGDPTARQVVEQKQQSLMRLGMLILGVINLEKQMAWKRLFNILRNWSQPDQVVFEKADGKLSTRLQYRTETMDAEFDDGEKGQRIIQFLNEELPASEQIMAEEEILTQRRGVPIRKVYLNAEELQSLKWRWFIEITPTEKDTSELRAAVFSDDLIKAMQIWGPQSINPAYSQKVWARQRNLNPEKFFNTQPDPMLMQQMMAQGAQPGSQEISSQAAPKEMPRPSINTLAQA